jgi:hypothetical protein
MTRTNVETVESIFTMCTWKIHVNLQALYGSVQKESAVHRFLHMVAEHLAPALL